MEIRSHIQINNTKVGIQVLNDKKINPWVEGLIKLAGLVTSLRFIVRHASSTKAYVLLDWSASIISFACTWFIYKHSANIHVLGNVGWILSLLTTSLFISSAAHYYSMFKKCGVYNTYLAFLPFICIETIIIRCIVDWKSTLLIFICLIFNVFFSAFRGDLMGKGKFPLVALCNIMEQISRLSCITFLFFRGNSIADSMLIGSATVYIFFGSTVFLALLFKQPRSPAFFSKERIHDVFWYVFINISIYFLMNGDVLSLKYQAAFKGEFILIKPWGQILIVIMMPFINLLLYLTQNKKSTKNIVYSASSVFLLFLLVGVLKGNTITHFIFGKQASSNGYIVLIIVEHLFISLILALLYKCLYLRKQSKHAMITIFVCSSFIITIPVLFPEKLIYTGYIILYGITYIIYKKKLAITDNIISKNK